MTPRTLADLPAPDPEAARRIVAILEAGDGKTARVS
jgi:hypothetical protein